MAKKIANKIGRVTRRMELVADIMLLLLCIASPLLIIFDLGFIHDAKDTAAVDSAYRTLLYSIWALVAFIFTLGGQSEKKGGQITIFAVFTTIVGIIFFADKGIIASDGLIDIISSNFVVMMSLLIISVLEVSKWVTSILGKKTSPPMLLASSFMFIIVVGSLLLMLPRCTTDSISYIDALFLSTSAVCVTGLSPLDISSALTIEGQVVILVLIQIGGLGVMTITSFFGLFFSSGRKFSGRMVVGDLISSNQMTGLLRTLSSILIVTLSIEAIGAIMLYGSVMETGSFSHSEGIYFAIFHSVSAFCNAGFSTLSGNLADPVIASLDTVRWVVGFLLIFGGIGFPIFSNFLRMAGHKIQNLARRALGHRAHIQPRLLQLNSYIVVSMTLILIISGWLGFLIIEWDSSLAGMDFTTKLSQSFLMSATPRTAGFNGVGMNTMMPASLVLTIVLMFIGGAPQSTAGGVKVTTVYLAVRNISAALRGTDITARYRRIPPSSVQSAFGIILTYLIVVMLALFTLSVLESDISISGLLFEVVSALSTVGLSLGVTPELGTYSKVVIIVLMFVGRVGLLSILVLFMRPSSLTSKANVSYPSENILIT